MKLADGERLVYTFFGTVAHIDSPWHRCNMLLGKFDEELMGTGSQDEYEKAASLPLCKRCRARKG